MRRQSASQLAQICQYVTDAKAIQHTILLKCKNETFGRADSLVKAGTRIQYDGFDLIAEGWEKAEIVTPAKFRSRPEKAAPTIAYDPGNGIEGSKPKTDVIPANATISLIARTPESGNQGSGRGVYNSGSGATRSWAPSAVPLPN